MSISTRKRFRVFTRDNFTCRYCNRSAFNDGVILHVDHVHPKSKLGSDELENLVTACKECNLGKKDEIIDLPFNKESKSPNLSQTFDKFLTSHPLFKKQVKDLEFNLRRETAALEEKIERLEREIISLKEETSTLKKSVSFYKKAYDQNSEYLKAEYTRSFRYCSMFFDIYLKYQELLSKKNS